MEGKVLRLISKLLFRGYGIELRAKLSPRSNGTIYDWKLLDFRLATRVSRPIRIWQTAVIIVVKLV